MSYGPGVFFIGENTMPNVPRVFKETQDQIIIQQGRGLQIVNNAATQRIIEAENYYKLFNGKRINFSHS